jgi:SAM-dependent methyltransferase
MKPHSKEWYERHATRQNGYFYPWRSRIDAGNGEDAYVELVRSHLSPTSDVLDVGCGHGEHALAIAAHCRSVLAYDRVALWIARAEAERSARGVGNVTFLCHDSSPEANGGRARLPGEARSRDLVISRRGRSTGSPTRGEWPARRDPAHAAARRANAERAAGARP